MKKSWASLSLFVLLVSSLLAQSGGSGDWSKYSSPEGKFSVLLPGEPKHSTSTENGAVLNNFELLQSPLIYMIVFSDYPSATLEKPIDVRLNAERDSFVKGLSANVQSEKRFKFQKGSHELPALQFVSDSAKPNANFKCVVVLDGTRVYFIGVGSLKGYDSTVQMDKFLDSFKLTEN